MSDLRTLVDSARQAFGAAANAPHYLSARNDMVAALSSYAQAAFSELTWIRMGGHSADALIPEGDEAPRLGKHVLGMLTILPSQLEHDAAELAKAVAANLEAIAWSLSPDATHKSLFAVERATAVYLSIAQMAQDPRVAAALAPHFGARGIVALVGAISLFVDDQQGFTFIDARNRLMATWLLRHPEREEISLRMRNAASQEFGLLTTHFLEREALQRALTEAPPQPWALRWVVYGLDLERRVQLSNTVPDGLPRFASLQNLKRVAESYLHNMLVTRRIVDRLGNPQAVRVPLAERLLKTWQTLLWAAEQQNPEFGNRRHYVGLSWQDRVLQAQSQMERAELIVDVARALDVSPERVDIAMTLYGVRDEPELRTRMGALLGSAAVSTLGNAYTIRSHVQRDLDPIYKRLSEGLK